jgi:hypothetical protein
MSAAASPAFQVKNTDGYIRVPASVIENQWALTPAELRLALAVARRNSGHAHARTLTETTWQSWTRLTPRHMHNAAKGLARKGLLIDGHGKKATYRFDPREWRNFIHTQSAKEKARTHGRKEAVAPRPGAMIAPQCRERGCAMLFEETGLTCGESSQDRKPVSKNGPILVPPPAPLNPHPQNQLTPTSATKFRKPVSEKLPLAAEWGATIAAVQAFFPLAGLLFLAQLLVAIKAIFGTKEFTDAEVAAAVVIAGNAAAGKQKGPGLFLLSVPGTLEAIQAGRIKPQTKRADSSPPPDLGGYGGTAKHQLQKMAAALDTLTTSTGDDRFAAVSSKIRAVAQGIAADADSDLVETLHPELQELSSRLFLAAHDLLNSDDRAELLQQSERQVSHSAPQRQSIVERVYANRVLRACGVPDLTVWWDA